MNTILHPIHESTPLDTMLFRLCNDFGPGREPSETAFIGEVGIHSGKKSVFLIGRTWIANLETMERWGQQNCPVRVDRFVDLEIKTIGKK